MLGIPESSRPSLNLNSVFANLENQPGVNFTRNTIRHYWNGEGILQEAATGTLPASYDPVTGNLQGWPIMGQWTNEILDPRDMTTGNWSGTATVTRDQVGIDGESNSACLLSDDNASSNLAVLSDQITVSDDSQTHTCALFIKKDEDESRFPEIQFRLRGGTDVDHYVQLNTKTGATVSRVNDGGDTEEVFDRGNWWLLTIQITNNATGNVGLALRVVPAVGTSIGGVEGTTGTIIVDAAQVFLNRSASPPTPVFGTTAGQAFTQDPDIATITDLSWFNPDEGTFVVDSSSASSSYSDAIGLSANSFDPNNRIILRRNSNRLYSEVNGNVEFDIQGTEIPQGDFAISAFALKKDNVAFATNGVLIGEDNNASILTPEKLFIGGEPGRKIEGFVRKIKYYPRRLSNAQLKSLTQ